MLDVLSLLLLLEAQAVMVVESGGVGVALCVIILSILCFKALTIIAHKWATDETSNSKKLCNEQYQELEG